MRRPDGFTVCVVLTSSLFASFWRLYYLRRADGFTICVVLTSLLLKNKWFISVVLYNSVETSRGTAIHFTSTFLRHNSHFYYSFSPIRLATSHQYDFQLPTNTTCYDHDTTFTSTTRLATTTIRRSWTKNKERLFTTSH